MQTITYKNKTTGEQITAKRKGSNSNWYFGNLSFKYSWTMDEYLSNFGYLRKK